MKKKCMHSKLPEYIPSAAMQEHCISLEFTEHNIQKHEKRASAAMLSELFDDFNPQDINSLGSALGKKKTKQNTQIS